MSEQRREGSVKYNKVIARSPHRRTEPYLSTCAHLLVIGQQKDDGIVRNHINKEISITLL